MSTPDASSPPLPEPAAPGAEPAQVWRALTARIVQSAVFAGSARHRALLEHLVARHLAGDAAALKESVIAVEVFGRRAGEYDPKAESLVRVEARRLRARLARFFMSHAAGEPWRLELPVGSYVPALVPARGTAQATEATRRARDLVERGDHFLRQPLSQACLLQAADRFDAALRESPDSVPALVGLARAWMNLALGWYAPPALWAEHAADACRRALQLDPKAAVAHALLAVWQHQFQRDWTAAERSFRRAIGCAPKAAFTHAAYGCHLTMRGRLADAEAALQAARQLDPQYVNARWHMVNLRIAAGRLDDAQAEIDAVLDIAPDSMAAVASAALLAWLQGRREAAVAGFRRAVELAPGYAGCEITLAGVLAWAGQHDEAAQWRDRALAEPRRLISPFVLAIAECRSGRFDAAFAALQEGLAQRDPSMAWAPGEPGLRALHGDPRWPDIVAAVWEARPGPRVQRVVATGGG
jgi:Tfp pilus assembly protein PilF